MRRVVAPAVLVAGSVLAAVVLAPTPDAITLLYHLAGFLSLSALGYWLGRWVEQVAPRIPPS